VDLINIGDTPPPVNVFKEIDADKDLVLSREEVRDSGEAASGIMRIITLHPHFEINYEILDSILFSCGKVILAAWGLC
jgi:hypothetical protein